MKDDYTNISPEDLAHAIAETSLSDSEKLHILNKLKTMSGRRLEALYEALIELRKAGENFINDVQRTDLKYRMMFMNEIEKEKAQEKKDI